jgi:oligosaccharide repeat unit polymerase
MGIYSTILASFLGIIIILNEFIRNKKTKPFDLFSGVNLMFFLTFVVPPFSIYFFGMRFAEWTYLVDIKSSSSIIALLYVIVGYLVLLTGLSFSKRWDFVRRLPSDFQMNNSSLEKFAHIIGILGIVFLLIFMFSIGGFEAFLSTNTLYRSGNAEVSSVAFIRNLALFIPISCLIFYGLSKVQKKKIFNRQKVFFVFYFIASLLLYFNRATRMGLLLFLISFFLMNTFYFKKKFLKYLPLMGGLFVAFILFGKRMFNYFLIDDFSFEADEMVLNKVIGEFSFPFFSLTNAIENSFFNSTPRLFFDFILGLLNLLPSAFIPFNVPKNMTQLNTESFLNMSGIPIDIISFGFYSFGLSGIIIIMFFFGTLIGCMEKVLANKGSLIVVVFYIQFIFFFSLLVPYAGPTNVMKSNICLFISFFIFIYLFERKKDKTYKYGIVLCEKTGE